MTTKDLHTVERAVALTLDFLREIPEDLRVAAIAASADGQPRRSSTLDRHAVRSRRLAADLDLAWSAATGAKPRASMAVGESTRSAGNAVGEMAMKLSGFTAVETSPPNADDKLHPDCASAGECQDWYQGPGPGCEGVCQRLVRAKRAANGGGLPEGVKAYPKPGPVERDYRKPEEVAGPEAVETAVGVDVLPRSREGGVELKLRGLSPTAKDSIAVGFARPGAPGLPPFVRRDLPSQDDCIDRRGDIALRFHSATPEKTRAVLFAIAGILGLEGDGHWTLDKITTEVRELASDAAHNDEQGRTFVGIGEVCDALGLSSTTKLTVSGEVEEIAIDRLTLLAKLNAHREAFDVAVSRLVGGAVEAAEKIRIVEDELFARMVARMAEVDPEGLAKLMGQT